MGDEPHTDGPAQKRVVVLGGGLAGLSTALQLIDRGFAVTLIEKRPFLGGRAFSFLDPKEQVEIDNGQHVFLGCCTYYVDYLRKIGATNKTYLQDRLKVVVIKDGKRGTIGSTPWLGRLHLFPSFLRYPHLGVSDKLRAIYGLASMALTRRKDGPSLLDLETAYDWLKRHGQSDRAISALWNLILLPSLNDDVRDASADMAIMLFQAGLLKGPREAAIGLSSVGLTSLNGDPALETLTQHGADMALGKTVRSITVDDGRATGIELSDGSTVEADAYVSALPFVVLLDSLPGDVRGNAFFSRAANLGSSPIVGVHLWYDRQIMDEEFVAFLDSPVQWVFNKSRIQRTTGDADGQYVCISLSGAWQFIDRPKDELATEFIAEMGRLFPRAASARVVRSLVVKEPQATFSAAPGTAEGRLPQTTPINNLFLAGEWTDTGWPSTMEGAVRSGVFAAEAVAESLGSGGSGS
jgi:squalene-associated FAD-dependent desaturase